MTAARKPAKPRTRRTRPRNGDTRARILAAARRVFIGEGYGAFTTRRVAREAGVSLGSLQHLFPSKEQLLEGTIYDVLGDYVRRYAAIEAQLPVNGDHRLRALVEYVLADIWRPETRRFFLNLLALGCHNGIAARLVNDVYARYRRRFANYIGASRPDLAESDCFDHGLLIAAMVVGLMAYTAPEARAISSQAQLAALVGRALARITD
ncbi:MAG: TetR/AcrR family transcriptional regulator [Steroidobacteraceae bacterium]